MKKTAILSSLLLIMLVACKQEPLNPVIGAWDLIYAKQVVNDSVVAIYPDTYQGSQVKMWCNNYWMFLNKYTADTVTTNGYGGGSYTLEGIVYKETIEYHVTGDFIGQTLRMRIVVANDTLIQVWPADETGEVDISNYWSEKYVRVK